MESVAEVSGAWRRVGVLKRTDDRGVCLDGGVELVDESERWVGLALLNGVDLADWASKGAGEEATEGEEGDE